MDIKAIDLQRLASFPEQNPNPVVEVSLSGDLTYSNPAAARMFPELKQEGIRHALFNKVRAQLDTSDKRAINEFTCEIELGQKVFEQKLFYIESADLVRVYSSDITRQKQVEKKLANLALFPEQNPNPVVEMSLDGSITYHNPAARQFFPDIKEKGMDHPLFRLVKENLRARTPGQLSNFTCEITVGERVFEQKLFFIDAGNVIRVYSSDITRQKETERKLANLALFPEQNPNPVIEVDSESGKVTYWNPAALRRFADLPDKGIGHELLQGVNRPEKKDFQREVQLGASVFEQKVYFIPGSRLIRVYSHDISEQKNIQKNLARLASFPELNPSPIVEIDLDGTITYHNPACRNTFPDLPALGLPHPVLEPFRERFEKLKSGEIANYVCEIRFGEHYYSQRARFMPENQVIRIFNNDITEQKRTEAIIREKNKDITDSINYARKIQRSILPSEDLVHKDIRDFFIFYKPKDIISGDFYWFTTAGEYFLFACADCTGHGVPGALMSMIGSNQLQHIVNERAISSPAAALQELDNRVRKALRQDDEPENRDGMDVAFCSLHVGKRILHYSGANRPIALIRNGELHEQEPTKFPIGGQYPGEKTFAGTAIQLHAGDCVYLFSDGITDQFGGPKGKKFMKKHFYELLLSLAAFPMSEQKEKLRAEFDSWKGPLEQTDDVCVIGIRMP
jgi:serine phosphatase RsbU (regulator of sigma subunit)/PAS domain-containing protein